jgi:hypothetical protein
MRRRMHVDGLCHADAYVRHSTVHLVFRPLIGYVECSSKARIEATVRYKLRLVARRHKMMVVGVLLVALYNTA